MLRLSDRLVTNPWPDKLIVLSVAPSIGKARALLVLCVLAGYAGYLVALMAGASPIHSVVAGMCLFCIFMLRVIPDVEDAYVAHVFRITRRQMLHDPRALAGVRIKAQWMLLASIALRCLAWLPIIVMLAAELISIDPTMISIRLAASSVPVTAWQLSWIALAAADLALTRETLKRRRGFVA